MQTSNDIIDRIDELVDEQLEDGEHISDYLTGDHTYPRCPHCGRHWHGLRITERIATMYSWGHYDNDYTVADDDSPVVCEGSDFIGPQRPQYQQAGSYRVALVPDTFTIRFVFDAEAMQRIAEQWRAAMQLMQEQFESFTHTVYNRYQSLFQMQTWTFHVAPDVPTECATFPNDLDIQWGPQHWLCEMKRIPTQLCFPSPYYRFLTPAETAIRQAWNEFTTPNYPIPERPGYDFSAYAHDVQYGPEHNQVLTRRGRRR